MNTKICLVSNDFWSQKSCLWAQSITCYLHVWSFFQSKEREREKKHLFLVFKIISWIRTVYLHFFQPTLKWILLQTASFTCVESQIYFCVISKIIIPQNISCLPGGTYNDQINQTAESTACQTCPAGYYCPAASSSVGPPCPRGFYCLEGQASGFEYACPVGTYG